ncbi:MAG: glycogen/starch/alpha-glucan phosphorylase [Candidatus Omnitrophica bacterium]|nr:glycogen/starch/alpha-glucan phosphorylase [Candidatus Omnitrophota bacterium]MCM8827104.1 glycogen/starch/alpha-glucan phosphorylase [Candidatus Omnitrophota bacterium]
MKRAKKVDREWKIVHKEMTKEGIKLAFRDNCEYALSKDQYTATTNDHFWALALAIRDRIVERWIVTQQKYHRENVKRVYYLSMEFLIGRLLDNYIINLGLEKEVSSALEEMGYNFKEIEEQEQDAGLGNGGLGRLAACFLDSMATLGIPCHGYGIRYEYGIFNQKIKDGYQVEMPDEWLKSGTPWEFARSEYPVKVHFYGKTINFYDKQGKFRVKWVDTEDVLAVPCDLPIPGYKNNTVNTLRLWSAKSTEEFDLEYFNSGDYEQAMQKKIISESISKVLYPNDEVSRGKELRLKQEYFFTAASISDIIRRFKAENSDLRKLPDKVVIHLNDTHPCLAIVELMRILLDEYEFDWDTSWDIVQKTFAYTNHTLMPEALELWPVSLLEKVLPRHLQIIYEINARFLNEVSQQFPGANEKLRRMSIIEENYPKSVRMANLAIVGSFSVNGVSKLHSHLLKTKFFKDFATFFPEKFNNKTNGITQRRWLLKANPLLSHLINQTIGKGWITDLEKIKKILPFKEEASFRKKWQEIKLENKKELAKYISRTTNIIVDPASMFDIQVKRIHEYKRQLLFCFYIISQYLTIKNEPNRFIQPRTFILGGKASPGYYMAKLIIKFINSVGEIVNRDKKVNDKIKVVFIENYRVSLAEKIIPAGELSEQISTAGMEASGTGNMKFALNGALTIGTLDGANIEIAESVGKENIFIFGHTAQEIEDIKNRGYDPQEYIKKSPILKEIFSLIMGNFFSPYHPGIFEPIIKTVYNIDTFFICADFTSYVNKQEEVARLYQNKEEWTKKSIINVANCGKFSSDRTIKEYAQEIWKIKPIQV